MSERWRGIVAALLNPDLRAALAELNEGAPLTEARRDRALARLEELGLVHRDENGSAAFADDRIREILAESARPRPTGPERYLDREGRIDRYPMRNDERRMLLAWVAERALSSGRTYSEAEVNEGLEPFTTDVAVLRRYLVDHGLLERTRSGSEYARVNPPQG